MSEVLQLHVLVVQFHFCKSTWSTLVSQ